MKTFITSLLLAITLGGHALAQSPATIPNNKLVVGKTGAADKVIELNLSKPGATANPKIKWNNTANQLQFSNNGTDFSSFGSGSGVTGNLLLNPSWELNTTNWTASAGTYVRESGAANIVPPGTGSGSWDAAASADTLTSNATTITAGDGISGSNIAGSCTIKCATGTCSHSIQIYDGTNILSTATISSSTAGFVRTTINAVAPTSGTISLRLYANANEPIAYVTDCFLGKAEGYNISQISQAQFYGAVKITGCSGAWTTTSGSYTNLSAQTSCSYSAMGNASAPATLIPGIRFASGLPAGTYAISYSGEVGRQASTATVFGRFSDGTNTSLEETYLSPGTAGSTQSAANFLGTFIVPTGQGDTTIQVQLKQSGGTAQIFGTTSTPGVISVYRFPTSSEIAYRANVASASGQGKYAGTASCQWTTTSATFANFAADTDCPTASVSGSATASGTKIPGFVFSSLPAGQYMVVANGGFDTQYASSTTTCSFALSDGTNTFAKTTSYATSGTGNAYLSSIVGYVNYAAFQPSLTIQAQGIRVSGGGTCTVDNSAASQEFQIQLIPLNQNFPMPYLVGSVTSNTSGQERIERVSVTSSCTSTPCTIASQSGSWLTSISRASAGNYTLNIAAGMFSATPTCVCYAGNTATLICQRLISSSTSSAININTSAVTTGTSTDGTFEVMCMGAK